jgi:hypothetical protein
LKAIDHTRHHRSRSRRCERFAIALALLACSTARGASIIVGNHVLLPNTPNQIITIQVTGGEQVAGEDFFAQIGDGGAFLGGLNSKPTFENVDIIGGTIFAANNNGAFGDPNGVPIGSNSAHPLIWVDGTTTLNGSITANGRLATLAIDTTGLNSGTFELRLTDVAGALGGFGTTLRSANGDAIPLNVINGSLVVSLPITGDYNLNGIVDAADYTVWRDTLGSMSDLRANGDDTAASAGVIDQADYSAWKDNFGTSVSGSAAVAVASVPEPLSEVLLLIGTITALAITIADRQLLRVVRTR